jgi:threonylcarbamoyladenosine tRNA methylthiotransferase MtaB
MGCLATRAPQDIRRLPGVTGIVTDRNRLTEELSAYGVTHVPLGITRFDGHQRAFVKVQDGCFLQCSFCIIPRVRPTLRSRPPEEILAEVAGLVERGCQEIVLTGIHLGHYGIDLSCGLPRQERRQLWNLLEQLAVLPGNFRIRLSSLDAEEVCDDLVRVMRDQPRVCPHLHLSLQSGSDRILAAMKRRSTSASFLKRCRLLQAALDEPALTTDVIVGFPGESEADFAATCRVLREVGFCKVHIFSFSPRPGTPAASLSGTVPPAVVAARRCRLLELEQELTNAYGRRLIDRRLDVLVEGADLSRTGHVRGTSCRYVPVIFPGFANALIGRRVQVRVITMADAVLLGHPVSVSETESLQQG